MDKGGIEKMSKKEEEEVIRCLNCNDPVSDRPFMYDSAHFCSGPCHDAYLRKLERKEQAEKK